MVYISSLLYYNTYYREDFFLFTSHQIKMNLLKEVKDQAIDYLTDNQDLETYGCDLHHEIFNTSYFCNSEKDAKNYLESYGVFEAIKEVRDYEKFNFGEVTTDISNPNKLINMLVYIKGEEILYKSNTLTNDYWNDYIPSEEYKNIIEEIKNS